MVFDGWFFLGVHHPLPAIRGDIRGDTTINNDVAQDSTVQKQKLFQISLSIAAKSKLVLWGNRVKNILLKLQLESFWDSKCAGLLKSEMKEMICSMYRMKRQKWKSDLVKMTKLRTCVTFSSHLNKRFTPTW